MRIQSVIGGLVDCEVDGYVYTILDYVQLNGTRKNMLPIFGFRSTDRTRYVGSVGGISSW